MNLEIKKFWAHRGRIKEELVGNRQYNRVTYYLFRGPNLLQEIAIRYQSKGHFSILYYYEGKTVTEEFMLRLTKLRAFL